jgi:hypothetical protein
MPFFTEIQKPILKFLSKYKITQIGKTRLSKRNISRDITIPAFKTILQRHSKKNSMALVQKQTVLLKNNTTIRSKSTQLQFSESYKGTKNIC